VSSGHDENRVGAASLPRDVRWRSAFAPPSSPRTTPLGGWRDPSNTQADLRDACATAGFDWVTTHAFRKTVATLDHAGVSAMGCCMTPTDADE
jgi:hypothetical protein